MDIIEMANAINSLFGSSNRMKNEDTVGRTRTYSGIATSDSNDGKVWVALDGDSVTQDGAQSVLIKTVVSVQEGQKVIVTVVNGVPTVTGIVGWGDSFETDMCQIIVALLGDPSVVATRAAELVAQIQNVDVTIVGLDGKSDRIITSLGGYREVGGIETNDFEKVYQQSQSIQTLNGFKNTVEQEYGANLSGISTTYATKTELSQSESQIQSRVEESIVIGGVNLLLDTDAPTLTKVTASANRYFSDSSNTSITASIVPCTDAPIAGIHNMQQYVVAAVSGHKNLVFYSPNADAITYEDGEEYTVSFYARVTSGVKGTIELRCSAFGVTGTQGAVDIENTEWKRYSWTYTANQSNGVFRPYIGVYGRYVATIEICGIKVEKGGYATDWNLSQEETASKTLVTQTAHDLSVDIQDAEKTATNFLLFDANGLCIADQTGQTLGLNVLITSSEIQIRSGTTVLARYGISSVDLGNNAETTIIRLCGSKGRIRYDAGANNETQLIAMYAPNGAILSSGSTDDAALVGYMGVVMGGTTAIVNTAKFFVTTVCSSNIEDFTIEAPSGVYAMRNQFGMVTVYTDGSYTINGNSSGNNAGTNFVFAGSTATVTGNGTVLPVGWRPKHTVKQGCMCGDCWGYLVVGTDGSVMFHRVTAQTTSGQLFCSLTYPADNQYAV